MRTQVNAGTAAARMTPSGIVLVLTALVVPGGLVVLGWLLLKHLGAWQALKRLAQAVVLVTALQGCATQFAQSGPVLRFQDPYARPAGEQAFIGPEALEPGDIVLTSMPGLAGAGIELLTIAPVSHVAIYVGEGRVVEAVRSGVGERSIAQVLDEESVALVLRYPGLAPAQARRIAQYARAKQGAGFSFVGVTLQIPYSVGRKLVCELPFVPGAVRDPCLRGLGLLSQLAAREQRLFCSQLVLQAYRHAGVALTEADPRMVSPADILHMREGDVPSVRIAQPLRYIGHLKYDRPVLLTAER